MEFIPEHGQTVKIMQLSVMSYKGAVSFTVKAEECNRNVVKIRLRYSQPREEHM
jgi:hypothetical protein